MSKKKEKKVRDKNEPFWSNKNFSHTISEIISLRAILKKRTKEDEPPDDSETKRRGEGEIE